ncbi:MAG: VWA domain-containing protein [Lentisphaeraceae bacterium]|nr:VWA domain-containing protein [Lentisphaeraceae bacterium]
MKDQRVSRWRLILGEAVEEQLSDVSEDFELSQDEQKMDGALGAIYDDYSVPDGSSGKKTQQVGGLKKSAPAIAKWLGDIRECFDSEAVAIVQRDAISKKGLNQLLYEPEILETVEPDIHLVGTLLALKDEIPEDSKEQVRTFISKFVDELSQSLKSKIENHIRGILNRQEQSFVPRYDSINWQKTIRQNLKNYNPELKKILPERIHYFAHQRKSSNWHIFINIDQSASMAESMVYAAVMGSIFASLPSTKTKVVAFDTAVVDLTEECGSDPVDMLYGMQLGGGTDINRAVTYTREFISEPSRSIYIMLSDLFEGGNRNQLLLQMQEMVESGVKVICLLTLSNAGLPYYDRLIASELQSLGIECFGCTPEKLPDFIKEILSGSR